MYACNKHEEKINTLIVFTVERLLGWHCFCLILGQQRRGWGVAEKQSRKSSFLIQLETIDKHCLPYQVIGLAQN